MMLNMMKSKIHRATVTEANLNYIGSITIDSNLLKAANMLPGEKVQIVNNSNGARIETYIIEGEPDSGIICLNGAAARHVQPGDNIIIIAYCWVTEEEAKNLKQSIVFVNESNKIVEKADIEKHGEIMQDTFMKFGIFDPQRTTEAVKMLLSSADINKKMSIY